MICGARINLVVGFLQMSAQWFINSVCFIRKLPHTQTYTHTHANMHANRKYRWNSAENQSALPKGGEK